MVDLVFTGGPVFVSDAARSRTHAVAVDGGRIVAVGRDAEALAPEAAEVVDLAGRMLVPGFQDAHVHPVWGGLDLLRCNLAEDYSREDYLARIAEYAASHPDEEWIVGGGWAMACFPGGTPLASDIDAIVSDRPVFLTNRDGHGAWANSKALQIAGLDASTSDPVDGRIERDAAGNPNGTLHEGAMSLVNRFLPVDSPETMLQGVLKGQEYLHSFGVTAWQDAAVGDYADAGDPAPAYLAAVEQGLLTARVVGSLWFERGLGVSQLPTLLERRETYTRGRLRCGTVKVMADGVPENFTAAMLEPYLDPCGHLHGESPGDGISFIPKDVLLEAVPVLDAHGFQVHMHAIGDRAVRDCLDAVEAAIAANGRGDNRHHIAHLQVVDPADVPRFGQLGVAANIQSLWAAYEKQMVELTMPFLGEARSLHQYPFRSLQSTGAVLVAGSDWSVSTPDPFKAIHVAVNRLAPRGDEDGDYEAFLPHEAIDLASSLAAYTSGSAWVNHLDDVSGSVEVGKDADLVVLDRDPFADEPMAVGDTRVLQTFVAGERVYAADDA